jgi:enoyl-CoA hydratase/carnithine racemase
MTEGRVNYEVHDRIAVIEIENGKVNPMTPSMHHQLHDTLVQFLAASEVHAGVLTGRGSRAFCAGDDLKHDHTDGSLRPAQELVAELGPGHRTHGAHPSWQWQYDVLQLPRYKPIVAAVNGWCLGIGLAYLVALTDIRVAGRSAKFGAPEIAYGMAGLGGTLRLSRQIPRIAANALLLTGEPMDADEARRVHLVNEVVDDDQTLPRALEIARRIAEHPLLSLRLEMEAMEQGEQLSREEAVRYGDRIYQLQRLAAGESEAESYRKHGPQAEQDRR